MAFSPPTTQLSMKTRFSSRNHDHQIHQKGCRCWRLWQCWAAYYKPLLSANFQVSVLSRISPTAAFLDEVNVIETDYSHDSLIQAFQGQDGVVSILSTYSVAKPAAIIDVAIAAGVRRFLPSEYGADSSTPAIGEGGLEPGLIKHETAGYLKFKEHRGLTWTALVGRFSCENLLSYLVGGIWLLSRYCLCYVESHLSGTFSAVSL
jgi:NAD(P)H-binding